MKGTTISTLILLISLGSLVRADFELDIEGSFTNEAISKDGSLLAVSTTMGTSIYKTSASDAKLEEITKLIFPLTVKNVQNLDYTINGYALTSSITNEGMFFANINGISLQAHQINLEAKTSTLKWSLPIVTSFSSLIALEGGLLVAQHSRGIIVFSTEDGSQVFVNDIDGMKKIVQLDNGNMAALVGEKIITLQKESFMNKNLLTDQLVELNQDRKFSGARNIFQLRGLREGKNYILLFRSVRELFVDIIDTDQMVVVNTFNSPHFFYDITSVSVVQGTDLLITTGDETVQVLKAFENKFGYASLVESVRYNHSVKRAVHIPGTTSFIATFGKSFEDSKGLVIRKFCGVKNCEECGVIGKCDKCVAGLEVDPETKMCKVKTL